MRPRAFQLASIACNRPGSSRSLTSSLRCRLDRLPRSWPKAAICLAVYQLIKRVLALPGQTICRKGAAIIVDGIEMGMARERDSRGRLLPAWQDCRVVAHGEVFLMNWDEPDSLDGRYFGTLATSSIIGRAEPLWTFEED